MCLGFPGVKNGDDNMYSLLTVNNMLGMDEFALVSKDT